MGGKFWEIVMGVEMVRPSIEGKLGGLENSKMTPQRGGFAKIGCSRFSGGGKVNIREPGTRRGGGLLGGGGVRGH